MSRVKIADFGVIQKGLANAVVSVYEADSSGESTGTLATLYQASTGVDARSNPQTLDTDGKLANDCYVDAVVVASISGINEATERSVKKIRANPLEYGLPLTSTNFSSSDTAADAATCAAAAISTAADAVSTAADAVQTAADRVQTGLDVVDTNADAVSTAADAVSSAASAAVAAAAVASAPYRDTKTITNADSPYSLVAADRGFFININATV